jgi:hypothetical protein
VTFQGNPESGQLAERYVREMCGNHPVKGRFLETATTSKAFRKVFQRLAGEFA